MNQAEIKEMEDLYRLGVYPKRDIAIVRGSGARLWDADGKEYLDFGMNYGVCNVGHGNTAVIEAIRKQLDEIVYVSSTYYNPVRARLMEKLAGITPGDLSRTFLSNSGTEAVEAALKIARNFNGRKKIIAAKRSYHGRTLGSLAATWNANYRAAGGIEMPDYKFVSFGDAGSLEEAVDADTSAVILEPVQGEGGVYPAPDGYLEEARRICDKNGALLIADEIQTGLGRTGKMFCVEHWNVVPDVLCIAKSLAGGIPIGATVARPGVCKMAKGSHGSTFGGNPVACAAALATIEYIEQNALPARAATLGKLLLESLGNIDARVIKEVRGIGLMAGIELRKKAGKYLSDMLDNGLIALPGGATVVRLLPPLVIPEDEMERGVGIIQKVFTSG
jgi:acetylornithine/LysW-gamma-L-lysine aminotransferase